MSQADGRLGQGYDIGLWGISFACHSAELLRYQWFMLTGTARHRSTKWPYASHQCKAVAVFDGIHKLSNHVMFLERTCLYMPFQLCIGADPLLKAQNSKRHY